MTALTVSTGHADVLPVVTVVLGPAFEAALVERGLASLTLHVVHPDRAAAWAYARQQGPATAHNNVKVINIVKELIL
jgi:hypothetical protein